MTLEQQKKLANHIIRLLKVRYVSFPVVSTDKGNLSLKLNGGEDFEIILDAVPLSTKDKFNDENNIQLKGLLEKYLFEKETFPHKLSEATTNGLTDLVEEPKNVVAPKKRGRPAKKK